ncbi:hypothetical protein AVEN_79079-1 [Araneus ventricosus]|uniref:Uncharacterized protein n=1 Tax=Araneus ventricosus TaxID=182803 RepID=A0A4Y2PX25_ARAVE|nr:hypothetical protein AVEN_79079-1 [Araneus ventricosus]
MQATLRLLDHLPGLFIVIAEPCRSFWSRYFANVSSQDVAFRRFRDHNAQFEVQKALKACSPDLPQQSDEFRLYHCLTSTPFSPGRIEISSATVWPESATPQQFSKKKKKNSLFPWLQQSQLPEKHKDSLP